MNREQKNREMQAVNCLLSGAVVEAMYTHKTSSARDKYKDAVYRAMPLFNDPEVDKDLITTYCNLVNQWNSTTDSYIDKTINSAKPFAYGALAAAIVIGGIRLLFGSSK